jgi:hypothetical protein
VRFVSAIRWNENSYVKLTSIAREIKKITFSHTKPLWFLACCTYFSIYGAATSLSKNHNIDLKPLSQMDFLVQPSFLLPSHIFHLLTFRKLLSYLHLSWPPALQLLNLTGSTLSYSLNTRSWASVIIFPFKVLWFHKLFTKQKATVC